MATVPAHGWTHGLGTRRRLYVYLQAACTNPNIPNVNALVVVGPNGFDPRKALPGSGKGPVAAECGQLELSRAPDHGEAQQRTAHARHLLLVTATRSTTLRIEAIRYWWTLTICGRTRASSSFDERHLATVSYVYQLPLKNFPRNFVDLVEERQPDADAPPKASCCSKLSNEILDGWELSGVTLYSFGNAVHGDQQRRGTPGISLTDNAGVSERTGRRRIGIPTW